MNLKTGYIKNNYSVPTKRYCQTLSLKENPALIAEYRKVHSQAEVWPEIREGIRSVGILEMEMYIFGSQVFMIVETPIDFDWDEAMKKAFSFASTARMGGLCSSLSGMCSGKYIGTEVEIDGTYILSL